MPYPDFQSELRGRLNVLCLSAVREAVALCQSRTFYEIDIPHVFLALLDPVRTDIESILSACNLSQGALRDDLRRGLDNFRTGNGSLPSVSPRLAEWLRAAWLTGSLEFGATRIRGGHLVLALLDNPRWRERWSEWGMERLADISPATLRAGWAEIVKASRENEMEPAAGGDGVPGPLPADAGGDAALGRFTLDLTARAREGKLDPVLGRDAEIRRIIDILMRRRQNNPILTGEAGVGKTAVVEGFAIKVAAGDVPPPLRNVRVLALDIGLMQAGAGVRGEFENRLKSLIAEAGRANPPVILFVDEAHTLIGAGAGEGKADAANLIKPALARGELRTIAATTWAEYKKYFEKDAALARRFQVIRVEEPDEENCLVMLRGMAERLTQHHGVPVLPEAVEAGVRLSARYISGRLLPDKAVSLLDTACARVAIGRAATPGAVETARSRVADVRTALDAWKRELAAGADCAGRVAATETELAEAERHLADLDAQWNGESGLADDIRAVRDELSGVPTSEEDRRSPLKDRLAGLRQELSLLQGDNPLLSPEVDRQAVAAVVAEWTGIPAGRVSESEKRALLGLEDALGKRVVGQSAALGAVADAVRAARAGLSDPAKPSGAFLFIGPSGVGKTETAMALAEALFGSERALTVINMSEFKEEHKISQLTGSPPGYVGYGEGGRLTEAVRRAPYGVILLDEMEKAHPGVQELFYQVFDKGTLRDGEGRDVDFRHSVIIAATNACGERLAALCPAGGAAPSPAEALADLRPHLLRSFKPAFLGRLAAVPFFPLGREELLSIARLHLARLATRLLERHGAELVWTPEAEELLIASGDSESGGRVVEQALGREAVPLLANRLLGDSPAGRVTLSAENGGMVIKNE